VSHYRFETRPTPCVVCRADVDQPLDVFAALAAGPDMIAAALADVSPAARDGWTPREVAAHLADLEVHRGVRVRRILAEDRPNIEPLDQDAWANALHTTERDVTYSLETYTTNRHSILEILRLASEAALSRTYQHNVFGRMTLGALMDHTTHHDLAHLRQILGD